MRTENSLLLTLLPHRFTDFMGPLKGLFYFVLRHKLAVCHTAAARISQ